MLQQDDILALSKTRRVIDSQRTTEQASLDPQPPSHGTETYY